jgi:hypothetical protein
VSGGGNTKRSIPLANNRGNAVNLASASDKARQDLEPNDAGGRRDDPRNVPGANRRRRSVSNAIDARRPEATMTPAHNQPGGLEGGAAVGAPDGVQPALIG